MAFAHTSFFCATLKGTLHVQKRAYLVFAYYGVEHRLAKGEAVAAPFEVGHYVDGYFTHLPYLLFKGHLAEPRLYFRLYFRVGRYGRAHLRRAVEASSGTQCRSHCNAF